MWEVELSDRQTGGRVEQLLLLDRGALAVALRRIVWHSCAAVRECHIGHSFISRCFKPLSLRGEGGGAVLLSSVSFQTAGSKEISNLSIEEAGTKRASALCVRYLVVN